MAGNANVATLGIVVKTTGVEEAISQTQRLASAAKEVEPATSRASASLSGFASANNTAAGAALAHGLQLGRLNMELGTAAGRLLGMNTAATRLAAMVAGNVFGYGPIIAATGAIVALAEGWRMWNEEAIKAEEQQKKLTKALEEWYEIEKGGVAGKRIEELDEQIKKVTELTKRYGDLKKMQGGKTSANLTMDDDPLGAAWIARQTEAAKNALDHAKIVEKAAQDDINKQITKAVYDKEAKYVEDLAHLIKFNTASKVEYDNALRMLSDFQAQLAGAGKAATPELRKNLVDWSHALQDAFVATIPKESAGLFSGESPVIAGLLKQLDAMRDVNVESNKSRTASAALTQQIGLEGYALDALKIRQDASAASDAARAKYSGDALKAALDTIEQNKLDAQVRLTLTTRIQDQRAAEDLLNASGKSAAVIAAEHAALVAKQTKETNDANEAYRKLASTIGGELVRGIADAATHVQSFTSLFQEVERLALHMAQQIEKALEDSSKRLTDNQIQNLQRFKSIAKAADIGAIAASGLINAYDTGKGAGSGTSAGLGGAAAGGEAGAAIGTLILPGLGTAIGAIIGAEAGFVAGLLGQAAKIRQLRKDYLDNEQKFIDSLASYPSQYAQTFAGIERAFKDLEAAAHAAHASVSADAIAAKNNAEAENTFNFIRDLGQQWNALSGPAGAYANQLDNINKQYLANIQTARALGKEEQLAGEIETIRKKSIEALITAEADAASLSQSLLQQFASANGFTLAGGDPFQSLRDAIQKALDQGLTDLAKSLTQELNLDETFKAWMDALQKTRDDAKVAADARAAQKQILQDQLDTDKEQLDVVTKSLTLQQKAVDSLRATVDALHKQTDSLRLSNLSPLSANDRYLEAARQYNLLATQVAAGDQSKISEFTAAQTAWLTESRAMFGSSGRYDQDFKQAEIFNATLTDHFQTQLTTEEKILSVLQYQSDQLNAQIALLSAQLQQSAMDAALSRQTYAVGSAKDPNFLVNNGYPGATAGLPPWDPNSPTGQALALAGTQGTGGGPGKVWIPGQGWVDPHMAGNEWMLDPENDSGAIRAAMKAAGYPGFAWGGDHWGGHMRINEFGGPGEVIATGPARVHTAQQLAAGGTDVIAAINTLTRVVSEKLGVTNDELKMQTRKFGRREMAGSS